MTTTFSSRPALCIIITLLAVHLAHAQMPAYTIYASDGKPRNFEKMANAARGAQVVLFGEHHDDPIAHWLQLRLAKSLSEHKKLVIAAEMLETDNQQAVDRYLTGEYTAKQLDSAARLWPNFKTDYKPIVDFAKEKKLRVIASNVPRRYASQVYKGGFEALSALPDQEKSYMPPMPIAYDPNLPGYVRMMKEMGGHGGDNLPKAQALKDATMAWSILRSLPQDGVLLHLNGTYHSDNHEGIGWYLRRENPRLKITTIATVSQDNVESLEAVHRGLADYIIVTPSDMTRTH